ncbi:MAG TPA: RecQ family ATP-dependent DNA helicase [Pseudobdellovibrionaceae bacterium]|nr:RecQ family ATP-dependent DNA helicase [Pseudobdellovibrionaceae bacterium]
MKALTQVHVFLLAIDEAHCISQWGHDFRPDYSKIAEIRKILGSPPVLALTATATPEVQKDIIDQIQIQEAQILHGGLKRDNLNLEVQEVFGLDQKIEKILEIQQSSSGVGIVYCSLVETVKKIYQRLESKNISKLWTYYGDMKPQYKEKALKEFIRSEKGIMLATPAFGLGIDKPDIRWVVHGELPGSLEAYFQEVGRGGRDGLPARGVLLYDQDDVEIQMEFLKWSHPHISFLLELYRLVKERSLELEQGGFEYLRNRMNYKNRRDYRSEAGVRILVRLGYVAQVETQGTLFPYVAIEDPDTGILQNQVSEDHLKNQQKKLLEMVRYANQGVENQGSELDLKKIIYKYFGVF